MAERLRNLGRVARQATEAGVLIALVRDPAVSKEVVEGGIALVTLAEMWLGHRRADRHSEAAVPLIKSPVKFQNPLRRAA